jgi:hypothetical protein
MKKEYCDRCNSRFALAQTQVTYKGKLYHGDCYVKVRRKEQEQNGQGSFVGGRHPTRGRMG